MNIEMPVELDLTLARGLNYYTGAIFEVKALDVPMGSICGGGRYDNLTGVFGMPDVSGVGISFGADRIFDVMQSLDLFPEKAMQSTQIIFLNFGAKELAYCLPYLQNLRSNGYSAEIYPDEAKIKKQLRYADQKQIPIVIMAGESEMDNNQFTVKQMQSGQQWTVSKDDLIEKLSDL
jgi:histidyl-tRNA synthetase